ncbi:uncharacterized protein LOC110246574 [Exaiptasia diaphana]|uniref:Tyr recombinase domain-containing protein n=1 Tax=Exaiptasia diaphana TaxID=2652724 RepID=A0A913XRL4_EXADI|nr:uncharacterized protein LOC110246574 [Exaiptasia diaphana]
MVYVRYQLLVQMLPLLQVCDASKRLLGRPVVKKEILEVRHVKSIVDKFAQLGASLSDLQVAVLIVVGFAGFLRWSDLSVIKVEDVVFYDSHMDVVLPKRKNDQRRSGSAISIASTGSVYCPVSLTRRFILRAGLLSGPLFRECVSRGVVKSLSSKALSYASARSQVLSAFTAIGLDAKKFGLHSLRAGGASAAARAGIPGRLISSHGGWKSDVSRNGYIKDCKDSILAVSKSLKL